ncbi:MAG: ferrous iron transport protein B [Deltaproteobacteria bacterium]|nr:ferrous iron transport protein B [Deltaproteobacteria bacterium]MBW2137782.1 ferrous iron transport protein B [Deltaproteobacteria bacterium]
MEREDKVKKIRVALSGNPNSGKSTVFNAITGARQHIANYPGVTVEKKTGSVSYKGRQIEVVDLPGTYSLTAYSLEEVVARDFLVNERPDVVVDIVDASNLDRNLYLAVQFKELGAPLILALNMIDVASSRGIHIDAETLSELLGSPVVPMVARSNKGINQLLDKIIEVSEEDQEWSPYVISYGNDVDQGLREIEDVIRGSDVCNKKYDPEWMALKCLEGDEQILGVLKRDAERFQKVDAVCSRVTRHLMNTLEEEPEGIIADHRYGHIAGITKKCVKRKIESRLNLSDRIDRVLTSRFVGPLIMVTILYCIYEFIFWASETPLVWLEGLFSWVRGVVSNLMPAGVLKSLVVSGVIDGVGGVLEFVPLILFMFFAIAIMEDSGYMARVAYMLDRVLRWFGLHGNSVLPLIISGGISGGCAVPGVMATRTLRDPKERIATLLVVPFMNCGAKLPVYGLLIGAFFYGNRAQMLFIFTMLSWGFALFGAKLIRSSVLRGPQTPFVMELPPYRVPTMKGLLIHTWERTWQYVKKAGTMILAVSLVLWAMMTFPGPSEERVRSFERMRNDARTSFLGLGPVRGVIKGPEDLERLEDLLGTLADRAREGDMGLKDLVESPYYPLARAIYIRSDSSMAKGGGPIEEDLIPIVDAYLLYRETLLDINTREQEAALKGTIAGRIGVILESLTRSSLGFDYRTNIALVGGFAAKEVIVSTLGTAYSLGEVDPENAVSLSERLRNDRNWNPLVAFTLILFTMLYVPCFATVISIKRESSWRWAGFSIAFNLIIAYLISLITHQVGLALGLGT